MGSRARLQVPVGVVPAALLRPIAVVRRRVRTQRALDGGAFMLALALAFVLGSVAALRLGLSSAPTSALLAWLALPLLGVAFGALRPLPPLLAPRLLDRAHGTNDLLSSALSFARLSAAERTPFMDACVASAARVAERAQPAAAAPLVAPRALRIAAALLVGTAVVLLLPERTEPVVATKAAAPHKPKLLHEEDIALVSAELAPLLPALDEDPLLAPLREELNALLEALKDERLERAEALLALRELQERLALDELAEDRAAHDEALRELGKQLAGGGPERALAEALAQADAEQAREEAERLARQLGASAKPEAGLERALRRASERPAATEQARERARKERERLLQKKQQEGAQSPEQQRLLQKKERELDQLERELAEKQDAERSLDELRRELGDTAKSIGARDQERAQEHMQRAAQALKKQASKKLSAEQRAALAQKLDQLRELISKQRGQQDGKDGQEGKDGQKGKGSGAPQAGDGQRRLDLARFGKLARGQGGDEGDEPGDGDTPGEGGQPKLLVPGAGGEGQSPLMLPGQEGEQALSAQDAPNARGGSRAGTGGRPELQREASARSGQHVDTRVEGEHGQGPTRSQIIHEAGQRGFASLPYQQVHTEYARHAERVLERDHVPGGYKFYVRRYFQLIRPREDAP